MTETAMPLCVFIGEIHPEEKKKNLSLLLPEQKKEKGRALLVLWIRVKKIRVTDV